MDKLSVIIRARNEEQHIGFALQSIYDSFGKDGIEVSESETKTEQSRLIAGLQLQYFLPELKLSFFPFWTFYC